MKEFDLIIRNS